MSFLLDVKSRNFKTEYTLRPRGIEKGNRQTIFNLRTVSPKIKGSRDALSLENGQHKASKPTDVRRTYSESKRTRGKQVEFALKNL